MPWSRVTALLAINRLCAPGSELAIEQRWHPSTALDDLLEIEEGKINGTRLYRRLDGILPHKTKLERYLKERYGALFGAEEEREPRASGGDAWLYSSPSAISKLWPKTLELSI